jgi:CheY-like chemotaxis protein
VLAALTGYGQPQDRDRAAAAGIEHHLLKPVDLERLRRLLDCDERALGGAAHVSGTALGPRHSGQ